MKTIVYTISIFILTLLTTSCDNNNEPDTSSEGEVSVTLNVSSQTPAKYEYITLQAIVNDGSNIDEIK